MANPRLARLEASVRAVWQGPLYSR